MRATEYLSLDALVLLMRQHGVGPVRDVGLLASAAERPRTTVFGAHAYPSIEEKAAALLHSICSNRALVDGNKRLSWLATTVFLELNGFDVGLPDDEVFAFVIRVAEGRLDVPEIATTLRAALVSLADD